MESYKITGRAGEGAHGCVYKGLDKRSDKIVALKKISINTELGIPKNTVREMCALRALKAKNIVKLFEITSMGSSVVFIMEFLPCSLQEILKTTKLSVPQTKSYSKMILNGVDFMHSNHIMHRDIKPANLLISPKKILKIADFGLARIYNQQEPLRQYSHQVATRWYRAPELLYGSRTYTPSVDVWSVGCIIAEMINTTPLFPGETDIEQLAIVLSTLGTPTKESWPDLPQLPDYNKISFISSPGKPWKRIIPGADSSTLDLLKKIIIYDGRRRPTAKQVYGNLFGR
ncbi:cyclin-dependent kinase 20-like isoform X2 [Anthonomus grandis grandis]|uniref:cyclin-dependent kinase 20-like isoform X2 n=1 Tax=Anthonomus grandis grandis TaxID=2921223 RepID=UPI0021650BBF|nr:cyclin-dependent kinase 20-like isoform X2 [Anthonomus grandis grandis]